jgi:hypothetical protein
MACVSDGQQLRETSRALDFETLQIDLLPFDFTVPQYRLTSCVRAPNTAIDVIEARIEKPDGERWAGVYQLLPPEEGGSVSCAAVELNVHDYCHRSPHPGSRSCMTVSYGGSSIKAHRTKRDQNASFQHLYAIIDGTLVVFAFDHKMAWKEIGQALEAMESMKRVTLSELLSYKPEGAIAGKLRSLSEKITGPKSHVDRISFTKLLPNPRPSRFDRIQGYAYWDNYGLEFKNNRSGEHSGLRIEFSETSRWPRLERCWSERDCDFVATTPNSRKIYSTWKHVGSGRPRQEVREYYVDIEGTLVILSWPHWTRSEGKPVFRSHEFAPNELETLIDSLETATSGDLLRFPNMSVLGTHGGAIRSRFSSGSIIEVSGHSIEVEEITTPVKTDCIRRREDGSPEAVGNPFARQNGPLECEP